MILFVPETIHSSPTTKTGADNARTALLLADSSWDRDEARETQRSWFLLAKNDEVIPPDAERLFAKRMGAETIELVSSHVAMVSHPDEVCGLIEKAASAVPVAT